MQHEAGILAIRERTPHEAIDLGIALLKRFPLRLYLIVSVPLVTVCVTLFLVSPWPWVPTFILWWLKPLWDRLVLLPASHLVFHPKARLGTLVLLVLRMPWADLISELSWRRFSPYRTYLLPARILEGLKGNVRQKRLKQLVRQNAGPVTLLTFAALGIEVALYLSSFPILLTLFPTIGPHLQFQSGNGVPCFAALVYVVCVLVVEPFYALAGFGLYLNTRTILEGWDLALVFRTIGRKAGTAALLLCCVLGFLIATPASYAQDSQPQPVDWAAKTRTVLADKEFGSEQEVPTWVSRSPNQGPTPKSPSTMGASGVTSSISNILSYGLLWILIGGGSAVIVGLIWSAVRSGRRKLGAPKVRTGPALESASVSAGYSLSTTGGSLFVPEWSIQAKKLWDDGLFGEAIAILYRTALHQIQDRLSLSFPQSATEYDCLLFLQEKIPPEDPILRCFSDVVRCRTLITYAMRPLPEPDFFTIHDHLIAIENKRNGF